MKINRNKPVIKALCAVFLLSAALSSCKSVKDLQPVEPEGTDPYETAEITEPEGTDPSEFEELVNPEPKSISRNLSDEGVLTASELYLYFMEQNPEADREMIVRMSGYYIEEAQTEGINSDCAWAQMCLETGYLRFGNLVTPEMHNYCGLGAIDADNRGEVFETEQLGVRAHIQHLHAYATTEEYVLKNELLDKRYKWVRPRGKAPTIFELAGTWAADRAYGEKLDTILTKMELSTVGQTINE